jgi:hypothetical protein
MASSLQDPWQKFCKILFVMVSGTASDGLKAWQVTKLCSQVSWLGVYSDVIYNIIYKIQIENIHNIIFCDVTP